MFQLFNRVKTLIESELNALVDKAEDPVSTLDQFMRDMEEDIREVETAVAKQISNEKMLQRKITEAEKMAAKREKQAIKALEAGNEELARRTLEDKKNHTETAETLRQYYEKAKEDTAILRSKLVEMKGEYNEMKLRKDSLKARAKSAQTRTKMNRMMSDISGDDFRGSFERMEEKVLQYEAEAETSEDMRSSSRSLDDEFKELDHHSVEDELTALKKKLGK